MSWEERTWFTAQKPPWTNLFVWGLGIAYPSWTWKIYDRRTSPIVFSTIYLPIPPSCWTFWQSTRCEKRRRYPRRWGHCCWVSDIGVGFIVQPFYTSFLVKWLQLNDPKCSTYKAFVVIGLTFSQASFLSVVAVSVDRFLTVHLHLRYHELVTHKRVVTVVISIWVLNAFVSLMVLWASLDTIRLIVAVTGAFGFIVTIVLYIRIYFIARRHKNQIQSLQIRRVEQTSEMARSFSCQCLLRVHFVTSMLFALCNLHGDWKFKCRRKEIFGSIFDVIVSQLVPEPYNLLLEDEKHKTLNHKRSAEHVSEPKSHFTLIISVALSRILTSHVIDVNDR